MEFEYTDNVMIGLCEIMRKRKLGQGAYRTVYEFGPDKTKVIKLEGNTSFQNIIEWETWNHVKYTKHAKWFAPVHSISANGKVLIQSRTKPLSRKKCPKKIPVFFTDLKSENWGKLDGRKVCHDYGSHLLMEKGMSSKMKKVLWS